MLLNVFPELFFVVGIVFDEAGHTTLAPNRSDGFSLVHPCDGGFERLAQRRIGSPVTTPVNST